jgi:hypothetical protein
MAGFGNPLETWNARLARDDFLFGEEPNWATHTPGRGPPSVTTDW